MNVSPQMFTKEEQNKLQKTGAHKWLVRAAYGYVIHWGRHDGCCT